MAAVVRVLVAIEPQMYQEVLASCFRQQRPHSEVVLASPETLQDEARRTRPHLIVANEVPPLLKEKKGVFWVEINIDERLGAEIRVDTTNTITTTIDNLCIEDLLAVVDKTEEELVHGA